MPIRWGWHFFVCTLYTIGLVLWEQLAAEVVEEIVVEDEDLTVAEDLVWTIDY